MRKDLWGQNLILVLIVVGVFYVIGITSEPRCIEAGCNNKQASGSSYCFLNSIRN